MSYSKDELNPPQWMNTDFFKTILRHSQNSDNISVVAYKIAPAVFMDDHYASIMFRVSVRYLLNNQTKDISLIVKAMPHEDGLKKNMLKDSYLFETESIMFDKILPEMSSLLKNAGVKQRISAEMLYYSLKPNKVIVLEDLKELGYERLPRKIPFQHELEMIARKLAELHATSFKMAADGNPVIATIKNNGLNKPQIAQLSFFKNSFKQFKDFVSSVEDFQIYAKKLEDLTYNKLLTKCVEEINKPALYNVLNHGDFHIKNMMFKLDDNKASEVILVDFQICNWGSPAIDLANVKNYKPLARDGLDKLYFNTFLDLLEKMEYKGKFPEFEDLQTELKRFQCLDLFVFMMVFPYMGQDLGELNLEELLTSKEYGTSYYHNKNFENICRQMFPIFLKEGYFDF